jgi:hypothetical protein
MTYPDIITHYHAKSKLSEAVFHKTKNEKKEEGEGRKACVRTDWQVPDRHFSE